MDGGLVTFLLGVASLVLVTDATYLDGYTMTSCTSLVPPGSNPSSEQTEDGGYTISVNTTTYTPTTIYTVTLSATTVRFTAFMVQARRKGTGATAGRFVDSRSVLSSKKAHTLTCNKSQDSITNSNPDGTVYPVTVSFLWRAPKSAFMDICFKSSFVELPNIWYKALDVCISPIKMATHPPPTLGVVTTQKASVLITLVASTQATTKIPLKVLSTQAVTTVQSTTRKPTTIPPNQPRITVKPSKAELSRGSKAEFHCELSGTPPPTLIQWNREDTGSDLGSSNPLVVDNVQFSDQGVYVCQAIASGSTVSSFGILVIKEKPVIMIQPTGLTFVLGNRSDDIELMCDANGGNPVSVVWIKDGKPLIGQNKHKLTVPSVRTSDGVYNCNFTNPYGYTLSQNAVITVQVMPSFTVQPEDVWTTAGSRAVFVCQIDGNPAPTLQWYKDGSALTHRTSNMLVIADVEKLHEGQYWCISTNVVGSTTSRKATLTVITKVPTFIQQPQSQAVNYGTTLTLTCITLAHPPPKIQWLKDGVVITGANGETFMITSFTYNDEGNYSCNATNTLGYNISAAANVVVYTATPTFVRQPEGGIIHIGDPFTFTCIAKGVPIPEYTWYKSNKLLVGATSTTLQIKTAGVSDSTFYYCKVTNIAGHKISNPVYLIVNPPPTTVAPTYPTSNASNATTLMVIANASSATTTETTQTDKQIETSGAPSRQTSTGALKITTSTSPTIISATATINATATSGTEGGASSSVRVAAIVAPIVTILSLIIILLVVLLLLQHRRQKRQKSKGMDRLALTDHSEMDGISELGSTSGDKVYVDPVKESIKSSADLEQLLGRTPTYIHRINKSSAVDGPGLRSLLERVTSHPDDSDELNEVKKQFEDTPSNMVTIQKTPAGTESKNRYMNVLPNPHSAVRLIPLNDDPTTTYINANYVRGYSRKNKAYIATQGPIPSTRNDFWRMIWEQNVSIIIMTTGLVERGRMKCCQYWPDSHEKEATYGKYVVAVVNESQTDHYTIKTLTVRKDVQASDEDESENNQEQEIRLVKHYWFTAWPDFGIPRETGPILDFLSIIQKDSASLPGPVLIHCSAGIGRTGTFIGIEMGMQQYTKEGLVDPLQYMCSMRQDRGGSVQTADQYLFIHQALADFIARKEA
ncbi:uncharacterized protein LOC134190608 [Corticium candelabrum]|uniref:uncharacterized protein LOC134190608 n=1 Tax=Corticium candelabrum TaxID=121492 RepID=UPI002E25B559|nr:uncharacterized protein LOC134190608 [Corticium candelabrum]